MGRDLHLYLSPVQRGFKEDFCFYCPLLCVITTCSDISLVSLQQAWALGEKHRCLFLIALPMQGLVWGKGRCGGGLFYFWYMITVLFFFNFPRMFG